MFNIQALHDKVEALLEEAKDSGATSAWHLNQRCVKALAYHLQEPEERWHQAHEEAWFEWTKAWDPEEEAFDFLVTLVNHFRLFLEDRIDATMQLNLVFLLAEFKAIAEKMEELDELDELMKTPESKCQLPEHVELVVDNGPLLCAPNPSPPQLELVETTDTDC